MDKIRLNRMLLAGLVTFFVWILVEIVVEQFIGINPGLVPARVGLVE